jgi:phosphohistidine phosphatase
MHLYLLRHGDALQLPSLSDSERPLSELGEHQARTVGGYLRSANIRIDKIFTSPLVRAVQTGELVAQALETEDTSKTEYLLPGSDKRQLFELLNSTDCESILLAGHQPHLSQTVSLLLSAREDIPIEFRKCSLAKLDVSPPVQRGCGMLEWLVPYQHMDSKRN